MRLMSILLVVFACLATASCQPVPKDCTQLHADPTGGGDRKVEILEPGKYCLMEDLHSRLDFPLHRSEPRLIQIWTSDVELDLMGHTLGRGRLFVQRDDRGIELISRKNDVIRNVLIKNGRMQDFDLAIYAGLHVPYGKTKNLQVEPIHDPATHTTKYPGRNIVLENVEFRGNTRDVLVQEWAYPLSPLPQADPAPLSAIEQGLRDVPECMRSGVNNCNGPVRVRYCWQVKPQELRLWSNTEQTCAQGGRGDTGVVLPGRGLGIEDRLVNQSDRPLDAPDLKVEQACVVSLQTQQCQP